MFISIIFASLLGNIVSKPLYTCGQIESEKKPYGAIERRVDCEYLKKGGMISVLEFKKQTDIQYGTALHFDSLWRKRDSCFFMNGERNGTCLNWDTAGNVVGRAAYRNGKNIGKRESYFAPGRPALIKNYNTAGKADGPWTEWWKNGNKKAEYVAKNGHIISGTEYYQDGKPRIRYRTKYEPENRNVLKMKHIEAQGWAPNGKSTGKIETGNGEWILFPDGRDTTDHSVFREVYKDSVMIKGEKLDSAEIVKWLKP
ncbi:MAG: hypothetical protein ABI036_11175 [Fibrobacteria bacterium]